MLCNVGDLLVAKQTSWTGLTSHYLVEELYGNKRFTIYFIIDGGELLNKYIA